MTHPAVTPSCVDRLNPSFLARHGMVPIGMREGRLAVAMRDCENHKAIAALRFATGLEIVAVPLLDPQLVGNFGVASAIRPTTTNPSLLDRALARLQFRVEPQALLAPLLLLLEAGYEPAEAGQRLLLIPAVDPRLLALARRLADGHALDVVIADAKLVPWLAEAMQAWTSRNLTQSDLVVNVLRSGPLALMQKGAARLAGEAAILSLPLAIVARQIPVQTTLVLALLTVLLFSSVRLLIAKHADNEAVRADVLGVVGTLTGLGLPPALAIRTGLSRLQTLSGKQLPAEASREDLADALLLPGMPTALLMHGDLYSGASRSGAYCLARAERQLNRFTWLLRASVLAAIGATVIMAMPR